MLDVAINLAPWTPPQWAEQCMASVHAAAQVATFPVRIVTAAAVAGHIGNARKAVLRKCTAEYVAFVDDDDFVLPNAFMCLLPGMVAGHAAVCARHIKRGAGMPDIKVRSRHHLTAFKREYLKAVNWVELPGGGFRQLIDNAPSVLDVHEFVYIRRTDRAAGRPK